MPKQLLPQPGVTDELGSSDKPWAKIVGTVIQRPDGTMFLVEGFDASKIGTGFISPDRIAGLNENTQIVGLGKTLQDIVNALFQGTGAPDYAAAINAGTTKLSGEQIQDATLNPSAFDASEKLLQAFLVGDAGSLVSDDYNATNAGFKLSKTEIKIFLATAMFAGILTGKIQIGNFLADGTNGISIIDPNVANSGLHIDQQGRMWIGSDTYDSAPVQFDQYGNFFLNATANSLSRIDAGAIDFTVGGVQASPSGGQYTGLVTLTALTRGAQIYYTTNGSDPTDSTNGARVLYSAPFNVSPSGSLTLKAAAFKLGIYGVIGQWIFTTSPNKVASPIFNPIPGYYTTNASTFPVALSSNTPGASIKYTIDGSAPGPANGTIYTTPILIPRPSTNFQIQAYAFKAGLVDSDPVSGYYTIKKGTGQGGGGGNTFG